MEFLGKYRHDNVETTCKLDNEVENVRKTVKVAVLEGDSKVKDLLAISYYDSKPCYLFYYSY